MAQRTFKLLALLLAFALAACDARAECGDEFFSQTTQKKLLQSEQMGALLMGSIIARWRDMVVSDGAEAVAPPVEYLKRALALDPDSDLLLRRLVHYCAAKPDSEAELCNFESAKRLTQRDAGNGQHWLYLSETQYADGQVNAALESLQRGANAPVFSINWPEQVMVYTDVVNTHIPNNKQCALKFAIGIAAADLPPYSPLFEMCRSNNTSDLWLEACGLVGYNMEYQGESAVTVSVGQALQRVVYELQGADELAEIVVARQGQLDDLQEQFSALEPCLPKDVDSQQAWLRDLAEHGEVSAMRLAVKNGTQCE